MSINNDIVNYVKNHEGCSKMDICKYLTRSTLIDPHKVYYSVNSSIKQGYITANISNGRYKCYAKEK